MQPGSRLIRRDTSALVVVLVRVGRARERGEKSDAQEPQSQRDGRPSPPPSPRFGTLSESDSPMSGPAATNERRTTQRSPRRSQSKHFLAAWGLLLSPIGHPSRVR